MKGASADWLSGGNYPYNWNYNNQTIINVNNVQNLALSWAFPLPASSSNPFYFEEGVIEPVIVHAGIAYFVTNFHRVYALSAANGQLLWYKDLPLNFSESEILDEGNGHYHMIWLSTRILNQPLLWIVANDFHVFALNALTGDIKIQFQPMNQSLLAPDAIPGNFGQYATIGNSLLIDDPRGIVMFGPGDTEGASAGRGFWEAWNVSTGNPSLMWRDFIMPPQNGRDPGWSLSSVENMTNAYIFNGTEAVNLKALSTTQLNATLYGDWGSLGFNGTHSAAGTNTGWGGTMALDPITGTAFIATSQASPDWNATFRPGPNLWSDSILSINDQTGKIHWAFQTTAHDLWDYDCAWSVMLENTTINGGKQETVFKGCKNGYFYALNANNGSLEWVFNPPTVVRTNCPNGQSNGPVNPLNATEMHLDTECNSSTWVIQNPAAYGAIESDPAYNPVTGMVFTATYNAPANFTFQDVPPTPGTFIDSSGAPLLIGGVLPYGQPNTTIYALNASTGQAVWHYTLPSNIGFRGGVADSGGVLFVPALDGYLYMLNDKTGQLISKLLIGDMNVEPAIAQDSNGNYKLIIPSTQSGPIGDSGIAANSVPGNIFAISLPNSTAPFSSTSRVTTTTTTTISLSEQSSTSIVIVVSSVSSNSGVPLAAFIAALAFVVILLITTTFFAIKRRSAGYSTPPTASKASQ